MTDIQKALRKITDPRELTEKRVQRLCIDLYRSVGVWVVEFSQPYRNTQTKGIPDLLCYWSNDNTTPEDEVTYKWWHEVKAAKGKRSPDQVAFHALLEDYGERVITGGLNTAIVLLQSAKIACFDTVEGHW